MIVLSKLLLFLGIIVRLSTCKNATDKDFNGVTRAIKQFSTTFYKVISGEISNDENFVCSPLSTYIGLAMISYGAEGKSKEQLLSALNLLNLSKDEIHNARSFLRLFKILRFSKGAEVVLAGGLFVNGTRLKVKDRFRKLHKYIFNTKIDLIDTSRPKEAARRINQWCEEHTHNRIKDVINPDSIHDALMIVINAVYFKANWSICFDTFLTKPDIFHINENTTVDVPMMTMSLVWLNTHDHVDLDAKSIELKYFDGDLDDSNNPFSMFIIVPNMIDKIGLEKIGKNLEKIDFAQLTENEDLKFVNLRLPKFNIESKTDLVPLLMQMGVTDIFDIMTANFSSISDDIRLEISKITQKAIIDVNEVGTVAAAADVAEFGDRIMMEPEDIHVDRPFFYAIVMRKTGIPMFYGRIVNPCN